MNIFTRLESHPIEPIVPVVLGMGNFDGLHLGHQEIIRRIREKTPTPEGRCSLLTFDPHPTRILKPDHRPAMLQTYRQKVELMESLGVQWLLMLPFTRVLAATSAKDFLTRILASFPMLKRIVVGERFRFGQDREGNVEMLRALGLSRQIEVDAVSEVRLGDRKISSTRIRGAVARGHIEEANEMLGRPYAIDGRVVPGDGRGRTIGFPTANVQPENELLPAPGVYGTTFRSLNRRFRSLTNVGRRPTFGGRTMTVETHVLDFDGDLYGEAVRIHFLSRVRDEMPFETPEALAAQIRKDVSAVRAQPEEI